MTLKNCPINRILLKFMHMFRNLLLFFVTALLFSCDTFHVNEEDQVIARVGSRYLYRSDIKDMLHDDLSTQDSLAMAKSVINAWAKKQLYFQQAQMQLDVDLQKELGGMVENYRLDLWTQTYKESLVKSTIDTLISDAVLSDYYKALSSTFSLKEDIVEARFIRLSKDNKDLDNIKAHFISNLDEDQVFLDSLSFHFTDYETRSGQWFYQRELTERLPALQAQSFADYLKKSQFFFIDDSIEVYLLAVNDFRRANDTIPFSKIKSTIRKIVFNRRKLEVEKNIDQEILNDAIQTNKFEIYP